MMGQESGHNWSARRKLISLVLSGCIAASAATPAFSNSYTYDALGRVVVAEYSGGVYVHYSYDAVGNRTSYVVNSSSTYTAPSYTAPNINNPPIVGTAYANAAGGPVSIAMVVGGLFLNAFGVGRDEDGDPLYVTAVGTPGHGTATFDWANITYTPSSTYFGADSVSFTLSDYRGGSGTGTLSIAVQQQIRSSSGVLASGYTAGTTGVFTRWVKRTSDNVMVCSQNANPCNSWIAGYAPTGTGTQVLRSY